jgi:hypothetical protein
MRFKICNVALCAAVTFVGASGEAAAQAPLGTRALGMAGAFVGVADDASAVYWNPAGLATGAIVSFLVTFADQETADDELQTLSGERHTGRMVALSLPPVGLAYYRIGSYGTTVSVPVVTATPSREEVRRSVQGLTTSTLGVSLLQSLTDYIVVAATPKVVWGSAARGVSSAVLAGGALDAASELDGRSDTAFDVDAAVMIAVQGLRAGVVARNLTTPSFAVADGSAIELSREVRAGVGWGSAWPGYSRVSVSLDGDLVSRVTPFGDRRDVAAGVETWWRERAIAVRAGVRRSTVGEARGAVTAGLSYAVRPSLYVEGHVAAGNINERGWSLGIRMGF